MWSLKKHISARKGRSAAGAGTSPAQSLNIGSVLRHARELTGDDIRACAKHLRIREPYLRAIEDSRFEDMPGRAYAVGFVRAYAIHLGLDGDKVVERFKVESNDNQAEPELVIPEPTAESGMPGGSLLAASVLLAALAYGGWYYMSAQTRMAAEAPGIDLPTRPAPVGAQYATRPAALANAQPNQSVNTPAPRPSSMPPAQAILSPSQQLAALPPQAGLAGAAPSVSAAASDDADEAEAEAETPPEPETLRPNVATTAATLPQAAAPADANAMARPPINPSAASAIAAPVSDGQAGSRPSRVVIRAIADSWLQVGDGRSPALFAQVLRAGDSFHVPDRAGLRFDTGNAGGLEITVDGRPVPSVGPSGSVRRNIPLDADKLVAGAFGQR